MDSNGAELVALGDRLFSKKAQLDELHQTIAELCYPERANFTVSRIEGDEYVRNLYDSGPAQMRRDLAGAIGAILRPRGKEWFRPTPADEWRRTDRGMAWCDFARDVMRRILYSDRSRFQKVMADTDDDFVTFGNAIPILTENPERSGFLFEMTHLRDNAWTVSRFGEVDVNHRKLKMTLRAVVQRWGEKALTPTQLKTLEKAPYEEIEIRHVCMPVKDFDPYRPRKKWGGKPWASIYLNPEGRHTIHEGGYWEFPYLHRRWRVPDDSCYGYSPAAVLGLVDGRVLQSQSRVILDAGELAVAPPLLAKRDAVLGGIQNYAGAVTWLDTEFDERFGEAVRPLETGGDVRLGLEMKMDTRQILQAAWYLNKLSLPSDKEMTAYEASERIAEYVRSAGPIFEPFEADNSRILDALFSAALRIGHFGPLETIPPEIRGGEIKFEFDTPVSQAYRRIKVVRAKEFLEAFGQVAQFDPSIKADVDFRTMFRETVENIGAETKWLKPKDVADQEIAAELEKLAEAEEMAKQQAMLEAADKAAGAGQKGMGALAQLPMLAAQSQALLGGPQGGQTPDDQLMLPEPQDPFADLGGLDLGAILNDVSYDDITDQAAAELGESGEPIPGGAAGAGALATRALR